MVDTPTPRQRHEHRREPVVDAEAAEDGDAAPEPAADAPHAEDAKAEDAKPEGPKRGGWWQRALGR